jgi:thiamine-phosphate pyrophosphorylase
MADRCLLYYITDRSQFRGGELDRRSALLAKIAEATRAGVDYIQLRERDLTARELEALAREIVGLVGENSPSARLLVNSRTDVALATGADGVHLRADDVAPYEVRQMLHGLQGLKPPALFTGSGAAASRALTESVHERSSSRFLVAASWHADEEMKRAESEAVDFVVFAPVFGKHSAPGTQPTGLDALRDACQAKIPVFALGGVTAENARSCLNAGAAGIAGIRLFQENKIEDVVRALRAL